MWNLKPKLKLERPWRGSCWHASSCRSQDHVLPMGKSVGSTHNINHCNLKVLRAYW
jgi:hypothetical protein